MMPPLPDKIQRNRRAALFRSVPIPCAANLWRRPRQAEFAKKSLKEKKALVSLTEAR
jgi:hypothetical protein